MMMEKNQWLTVSSFSSLLGAHIDKGCPPLEASGC